MFFVKHFNVVPVSNFSISVINVTILMSMISVGPLKFGANLGFLPV